MEISCEGQGCTCDSASARLTRSAARSGAAPRPCTSRRTRSRCSGCSSRAGRARSSKAELLDALWPRHVRHRGEPRRPRGGDPPRHRRRRARAALPADGARIRLRVLGRSRRSGGRRQRFPPRLGRCAKFRSARARTCSGAIRRDDRDRGRHGLAPPRPHRDPRRPRARSRTSAARTARGSAASGSPSSEPLADGDEIRVGPAAMTFRCFATARLDRRP